MIVIKDFVGTIKKDDYFDYLFDDFYISLYGIDDCKELDSDIIIDMISQKVNSKDIINALID